MGELCPGAVQKPAAVLLPLDLFPCPRPSSLEPIALSHPNFQTTKTCRGRVVGCAPGAVLGPGAVPQPRFRGPSSPPPSPSPSPCPQPPFLERRARGGSCAPPPRDLEPAASTARPAGIRDHDGGVGFVDDLREGRGPGLALFVGHADQGSGQLVVFWELGNPRAFEDGAPLAVVERAGPPTRDERLLRVGLRGAARLDGRFLRVGFLVRGCFDGRRGFGGLDGRRRVRVGFLVRGCFGGRRGFGGLDGRRRVRVGFRGRGGHGAGELALEAGRKLSPDPGGDVDVLLVTEPIEESPHLGVDPEAEEDGFLRNTGTRRAAVEVLRGDPHEVAAVADGLPFKHRYTSGLMAWSPEDAPTRAELERVVDEFEETAWTGLERDRYVWAVILHRDHDGGVHLHIFAARCDLATGRSLNIAPPGWQKTFDPLRDALNFEHGWSRPDDPARARPNRPAPYRAYLDAETLRAGWEVEPNPRELIGQHLMARVAAGTVTDRAGVVAALEELDLEVTRQGEHYVTARHPETGDRWRLKGTLYERDFDRERFVRQQAPEPSGDREPADRGDDAARAAEAWQEVEEQRGQRAKYHQARYGGSREGRAQAGGARDAAGDVERESGPAAAALGREAGPESLAGHLRGELGDDAVVAAEDSAAEREQELEAIRGAAAGDATACLAVLARVDVVHDRDRAAADSGLASVVHAVRAGAEAAGRADRVLAGAGRVLAGAGRTARGCGDALDRAIRDAGPDLAELMRQRQEQRALAVAGREQAVCAMSKGAEWLDEVRQEVLADADRRPTVAEKERIVEPVEDRIRIYLAGLEESLAATSAGAALLREEYGEGGAAAAPLQSFAKQEAFVEQVAQQVDQQLGAREEVLRSLVERYLSEAKEALTGGVEGSLPRAERESKLNAVERLVGEELDRREEQVRAIAGSDRPIEEAIEALMEDGTISGDGSLTKRAQIIETAEGFLKDDLADLEAEEAAILKEPAGEERLRNARVEVLGADREAKTVVEHEAIIDLVQLAIREDTLRQVPLGQQYLSEAEQARTREGPPTQAERKSMVNAVEQRVREELDRREKRLKASERGAVLLADGFDELTGGSGSGRTLTQRWQIIDRAESWREEDLTECVSRVAAQFDARGGDEVLFAALDKQKKPGWRKQETLSAVLDQALAAVEKEPDRREEAPWHDVVLKAEQKFPHATSQTWHEAGDGIDRSTVIDRHAGSISQTLSDRARVRALAAEESEPAPARNLVQRVIDWLRAQVERLLRERVAAAEAEDRRKREAAAAAARQQREAAAAAARQQREAAAAAARQQREAAAAAARQQREAAAAAARQQREAAAAAARQQRWNDLEAFPGAQDAASARFDRLEPGWRDKSSVSRQCFNQVVGEIPWR